VHPTEYNLELFTYLIDQKIVDIDHLKITGIYHEKESYDYSISEDFLEKNSYPYIHLVEITNELSPDDLFKSNQLTETFSNLFNKSDGIFFFGGPDLPPSIYGEQMSLLTRMTDPYRHYFEASFLFHLLGGSQNNDFIPLLETKPEYVVYGICLGMQTMNIAAGGTMIQDIPSELYHFNSVEEVLATDRNMQHRNYNHNLTVDESLYSGSFHQIRITESKPLVNNYNNNLEPLIYSNHHQAIESLGKNLEVIATSMDGKIIEAIRHKKYPNVIGIQFHPEGVYLHSDEPVYRISPGKDTKSGKEILSENNSYLFHLEFWKAFSSRINSNY
jgi:putative glutamine amidotransferase